MDISIKENFQPHQIKKIINIYIKNKKKNSSKKFVESAVSFQVG